MQGLRLSLVLVLISMAFSLHDDSPLRDGFSNSRIWRGVFENPFKSFYSSIRQKLGWIKDQPTTEAPLPVLPVIPKREPFTPTVFTSETACSYIGGAVFVIEGGPGPCLKNLETLTTRDMAMDLCIADGAFLFFYLRNAPTEQFFSKFGVAPGESFHNIKIDDCPDPSDTECCSISTANAGSTAFVTTGGKCDDPHGVICYHPMPIEVATALEAARADAAAMEAALAAGEAFAIIRAHYEEKVAAAAAAAEKTKFPKLRRWFKDWIVLNFKISENGIQIICFTRNGYII